MKFWMCAGALLASLSVHAHEFWMQPDNFSPTLGTPVQFSLQVGEHFEGHAVEISTALVRGLHKHTRTGVTDLLGSLPADAGGRSGSLSGGNAGPPSSARASLLTAFQNQFNPILILGVIPVRLLGATCRHS